MSVTRWSDPGFEAIARLVRERAGLVFSPGRQAYADTIMRQAMKQARLRDGAAYLARLTQDDGALDDLLAELTVGETYFFREPAQFEYLRESLLPELRTRHGQEHTIRAWSAGCATGEEAYTLSMMLAGAGGPAQVIGTDISRTRLAFARRAQYRPWSLRGLGESVARRAFTRLGNEFLLAPAFRDSVEFRYLNLARDVYPAISAGIWGMDIILCRNVLIYMDGETIARVAERLLDTLAADGVLLLGASDPPLTEYMPCDVVRAGPIVAYRRPRPARVPAPADGAPGRQLTPGQAGSALEPATPVRRGPSSAGQAESVPLAEPASAEVSVSAPAGVAGPEAPTDDIGAAYRARDYDAVVTLARRQLAAGSSESTWTALVRALANLGRLEEAGRECAAALDVHRTSIELLYLHAVLVAQAGRAPEAADAARRVLYLDRRFIVGHLALGGALARAGDRAGALRAYGAAERLLAGMAPDTIVPASDGEPAGRLLEMARLQTRLLRRSAA